VRESKQQQDTLYPRLNIPQPYKELNFQPNYVDDTYPQVTNKHNTQFFKISPISLLADFNIHFIIKKKKILYEATRLNLKHSSPVFRRIRKTRPWGAMQRTLETWWKPSREVSSVHLKMQDTK
jgi:hypothetical protein